VETVFLELDEVPYSTMLRGMISGTKILVLEKTDVNKRIIK
jgi:hypothetical protein